MGTYRAERIPVLEFHELTAGKLVALLARRASRDLFDAYHLFVDLHLGLTPRLQLRTNPSQAKPRVTLSKAWATAAGSVSMQETAAFGSDFGANQHPDLLPALQMSAIGLCSGTLNGKLKPSSSAAIRPLALSTSRVSNSV